MKTKIFTFLLVGMVLCTASKLRAQNLLYDGDFSLTTEIVPLNTPEPSNFWWTWLNYDTGTNGIATVVSGVCNYKIISPGINTWDVQLAQWGFPLIQGHAYRLSFKVKADEARPFGVFLGENMGNWTNLNPEYDQWATTDWETISIDFNATQVFAYHKLSFELGGVGINMYFDDIVLEDMGEYPKTVGIIGNSVNGWDVDVDMFTTDEIHYTLIDYPLTTGWLRFRQDDNWILSWGNNTFPDGIAYPTGSDIPINYGNYNISFNLETGEYSFECTGDCPTSIGLIGSAVTPYNDWETDIKMFTYDGIIYTRSNHAFTDGEAKFRKNDSMEQLWGSSEFPSGTAQEGGPGIPVPTGLYTITFNNTTGDYNFALPSVGILGDALIGWDEDIDMETMDGVNFTLSEYPFIDGYVKFRLENSWEINWGGGNGFPEGVATLYGPNIYVPAGIYDVTFNQLTLEYTFKATTCPAPEIQCPWDIYIESEPGMCGSTVYYEEVTAAASCGGDGITIVQIEGRPSGSLFPIGITYNTFLLTNAEGNTATCSFMVYVYNSEQQCPSDIYMESEPGLCGAIVYYPNINVDASCGSDVTIEQIQGLPSGSLFPVGPTYNTFVITDGEGNTTSCGFMVYVYNAEPLIITNLKEDWEPIWPPNHKMVNVYLDYSVDNACGEVYTDIYVYSNEPEDGTGEGDKSPDWEIVDAHNVLLRAERSATGTGREYYIYVFIHDESWNYDGKQIIIKVPHDSGNLTKKGAWSRTEGMSTELLAPEETISFNARIWPNPASRAFNFEINSSTKEKVVMSIFDINGHLILNIETSENQYLQFGDDLKAGMYHVIVRQGNDHKYFKVIKQP